VVKENPIPLFFLNDHFVPKADIHVHSSPIASNKSAGTFAGILKIEKT
jgi:hypothetical protein